MCWTPLLKARPLSSRAWIFPSSNDLCPSPISGRRRGARPFAPLPRLLLTLCPDQERVFWPWTLHPAPVLSFPCLCSAPQASSNWRSESSAQRTIYEISPSDIASLQLNEHFNLLLRPLESAVLILGSAQTIPSSVVFCGGWAVMDASPHLSNMSFITLLLYLKRQQATCEHFVVPRWCRTGAG